jgi:hypothetical protein
MGDFVRRLSVQAESHAPSEGIFYALRFADKWDPIGLRFYSVDDIGHPIFWREHVVPRLARTWARVLQKSASELESELRLYEYGFPHTEAATAICSAREMLREVYPTVDPKFRERLKKIDQVLLDGLGCFLPEGPDGIGVDGQPTKPSWSQET